LDAQLIAAAREGDERAFGRLLEEVRSKIFRWSLLMTADSDEAEDITQKVSITLHRKLHTYEGRSQFATWLYRIVRNTALETRRRVRFTRETSLDDDVPTAQLSRVMEDRLEQIHNAQSVELIRALFTTLPPRQRELLDLVDTQGFKVVEAAEMMEIEPETARVHLLRARRTLRAKMLELHPERFE
jgi:RNA polymerase sigma-70 factor, ECF subfamily